MLKFSIGQQSSEVDVGRDRHDGRSPNADIAVLPLRLFLVAGWLRVVIEKLIEPNWWSGDEIRAFVADSREPALPFMRSGMDIAAGSLAPLFALVFVGAQLYVGVSLLLGAHLRRALTVAVAMNIVFVACGAVNPSAFYLAMEVALLSALGLGRGGLAASIDTRWLPYAAAALFGVAVVFVPFIRTIHPAEVIEDPAMMLTFLSLVGAATLVVCWLDRTTAGDRCDAVVTLEVGRLRSWTSGRSADTPGDGGVRHLMVAPDWAPPPTVVDQPSRSRSA